MCFTSGMCVSVQPSVPNGYLGSGNGNQNGMPQTEALYQLVSGYCILCVQCRYTVQYAVKDM